MAVKKVWAEGAAAISLGGTAISFESY